MEHKNTNRKTQTQTLHKVFTYIKKYQIFLFLSLILALITVGTTLYLPILIGECIDQVIKKGQVNFLALLPILRTMLHVVLVTAIAQWLMNLCNNKMTFLVVSDLRKAAFERLQILPVAYQDKHSYGDLVSRMIADADLFADGLLMGFTQLFTGIITILGTLFFMIRINAKITLVVVIITPISFWIAGFIAKRTYKMFQLQSKTRGEQTALIEEMIGNQKVVQAFLQEENCLKRFDETNKRLETYSLSATFFSSLTNPATRFVNNLVYTGVGIFGAIAAMNGNLSIGQLTAFLSYANQYNKPFNDISSVITELQNSLACAARLFELIEETPQVPDKEDAIDLAQADGRVTFSNVAFSYQKDKKFIEEFNLTVEPGQRIAIVGPTGCGKTTLINLLMRFYDVDGGTIQVMGKDIRDIKRKSLRSNFGMVLQETWLKSATIRENIMMGKPDATEEEMLEAAKKSHAHNFIKRLPKGYDTQIGEEGGSLSQGQKQLLCIARVMLSLPPMLILDEATSSIDTRTEWIVQHAFTNLMQGRTCFIVAHRLSTIREADVILVMKDGHIIEHGNHETLLANDGFYANLYHSQFAM